MNGHDHAPVRDHMIRRAKLYLAVGPLHECGFCSQAGALFAPDDHTAYFGQDTIFALSATRHVSIEGDRGARIVRLTS